MCVCFASRYLPSNGQRFFLLDKKRCFFIDYLSEKAFYSRVKCKKMRSVFEMSEMDGGFLCVFGIHAGTICVFLV